MVSTKKARMAALEFLSDNICAIASTIIGSMRYVHGISIGGNRDCSDPVVSTAVS